MKVLDVDLFQEGLHRNITMLTRLSTETKAILLAVEGLVQMEEQLKGEGGNAIRSFYEECHLPFLQFFQLFSEHYQQILHQMEAALHSLEPDSSGYILESFLEGELEQGLTEIRQLTANLTDETNSIMDQVSDIVSLPHLDDSGVQEGVISSKRKRDYTISQLYEFDVTQTNALHSIEQDIQTMETWLTDLEGMFETGLTDIHFQTENWGVLTSKNNLKTDLVYRTKLVDELPTILDVDSQITTMLQTFLAGAGPFKYGYGGFINIQNPFVGTDMIALSCARIEGNGTKQEKINTKKNSNILQDLADLGIGAVRSIPSFFTGDFGTKMVKEAEKIAPRQSYSFENVQRFSNRTANSALLGIPAQLEKNVTGEISPFQSQRKFGEGGGTDALANMLGYLVPGVGIVKGIRGTALGAKGLKTGASTHNIRQLAKEGATVGGSMSGVEIGGRELLNPEDTNWKQNALELGLNVGAGAALDPLVSLSVPIAKSLQKSLNDKSIMKAGNSSAKTGEKIPKVSGVPDKKVVGGGKISVDEFLKEMAELPHAKITKKIEDGIVSIPKGKRPNTELYLTKSEIEAHLSLFDDGVVKIQSKESFDNAVKLYGSNIGDPKTGTYVLPQNIVGKAISASEGNPRVLEKLLGLEPGYLGDTPVLLEITNAKNIRVPSGNEAGAWQGYWVPGGYTDGGIPEAVTDQIKASDYIISSVY
ncbi:ribonuclease YeeF family protein [Psychrobacillus psychrotolerans]|uniref:ribonuclease YeeF family protein n=1 Tax=Psychrobacillus psychrotolerans TaxID=126156 RepID=UPI003B01CDC3